MPRSPRWLTLLLALSGGPAFAQASEAAARVDAIDREVRLARDEVELVERAYTNVPEPTGEALLLQQYQEAEKQLALQDYQGASVKLYDLVSSKEFKEHRLYGEALYKLADTLYRMKNDLGARLYLREVLRRGVNGGHYKEALARYLEIAGRLNEFAGVDEYVAQAKNISGGQLTSELNYFYGKWMFQRQDLPLEERLQKAESTLTQLASYANPHQAQAIYFLGVAAVRLKQWDKAIDRFKELAKRPAKGTQEARIVELANLSLGRVYFEVGKYDLAIEHYQTVEHDSENFPDALYESAWAFVRKGDLARARSTTEVLLLVAANSVLAPEAKILQGTLLQKLQKYDEAVDTYNQVINQYAPVRDEIQALLDQHQDPVQYFDDLLARNEKTLDVTKLLPPIALKWASTRNDVTDARAITGALDVSRQDLAESRKLVEQILKSLEERGLESFPMLQEGYARADAIDTRLTRAREGLLTAETQLVQGALSPAQVTQLGQLRQQRDALKQRLDTLPTTPEQVAARRERIQKEIDRLDKQAFQVSLEIEATNAEIIAIRKLIDDTRAQRKGARDAEQGWLDDLLEPAKELERYRDEIEQVRADLLAQKNTADKAISGEGQLRTDYQQLLAEEESLLAQARGAVGGAAAQVLNRIAVVKADADAIHQRVGQAKVIVRERVAAKMAAVREDVLNEQKRVEEYGGISDGLTAETRNLVGRIAYDSFRRVKQSFYDLVLKADVGVVDVAFQQKQDRTTAIQKLAQQKEKELKQLDDEFKEVLKDVE